MIMLYYHLYSGDSDEKISIGAYLPSPADEIAGSFPRSGIVSIEKRVEDFMRDAKTAFPLGIIVYEFITDTVIHAFIGRAGGMISLSAIRKEGRVVITIGYNGAGIPEAVDIEGISGFGLRLVGLPVKQTGGTIRIERKWGTQFVMEFER
jgi:two-component sensor histidine kinase